MRQGWMRPRLVPQNLLFASSGGSEWRVTGLPPS